MSPNHMKKSNVAYLALIMGACGFFICSAFFSDNHSYESAKDPGFRVEECIEGSFYATEVGGGLGNVVFELLAFIGIAKVSGRLPIVTNENALKRIEELKGYLPELHAYFKQMESNKGMCIYATRSLSTMGKCCTYDNDTIGNVRNATERTVFLKEIYTQGVKYVRNVPKPLLEQLFTVSDAVQSEVKRLFPAEVLKSDSKKICMHIRLGDFTTSPIVYPSFENFTVASVRHVQKSVGGNSTILVFSNDVNRSSKWFAPFKNVHHAFFNKSRPANTEWEFSRQYCDVMVITASSSTYGWWMGFLSKGQQVYYNKDFSKPNGIENELNPHDFWPSGWIPLKLEGNTTEELPFNAK